MFYKLDRKTSRILLYNFLSSNDNWNISIALTAIDDNDLTNWLAVSRFIKTPLLRL